MREDRHITFQKIRKNLDEIEEDIARMYQEAKPGECDDNTHLFVTTLQKEIAQFRVDLSALGENLLDPKIEKAREQVYLSLLDLDKEALAGMIMEEYSIEDLLELAKACDDPMENRPVPGTMVKPICCPRCGSKEIAMDGTKDPAPETMDYCCMSCTHCWSFKTYEPETVK